MILCTLEHCPITQEDDKRIWFKADADIDADGANGISLHPITGDPLFAYAPGDLGLDHLRNAGYPHGSYRDILVCDDATGLPITFNGGYYSKTAWFDKALTWNDPARYLDSCSVPYIVVEGFIRRRAKGIVLGCQARITYKGVSVPCVVGDMGPLYKIGEISIAAAEAVGINSNARTGGISEHELLYEIFPDLPAVVLGKRYDLIKV